MTNWGVFVVCILVINAALAMNAIGCTGQQRKVARDVLDVIEVVCAPTDNRESCLDKLVAMRARETGAAGSASAAGPVAPPPASGAFSGKPSAPPAPCGSVAP